MRVRCLPSRPRLASLRKEATTLVSCPAPHRQRNLKRRRGRGDGWRAATGRQAVHLALLARRVGGSRELASSAVEPPSLWLSSLPLSSSLLLSPLRATQELRPDMKESFSWSSSEQPPQKRRLKRDSEHLCPRPRGGAKEPRSQIPSHPPLRSPSTSKSDQTGSGVE